MIKTIELWNIIISVGCEEEHFVLVDIDFYKNKESGSPTLAIFFCNFFIIISLINLNK